MRDFKEGSLTFRFPEGMRVFKYDDSTFYRKQFHAAFGGNKALDFILMEKGQTWLMEVKDYRGRTRTKALDLADELAFKVRDTLAGLTVAQNTASNGEEKELAALALAKKGFRIVLHLEQAKNHSKLFPQAVDPANLLIKMKQKLKTIDPHPRIVNQARLKTELPWDALD
ncbi:hypothetical protein LZ24_00366 [Desulfobotulus alkaliphilus]|uniref:Cysteinyl-tRNA synthetase n=1 Tax=Desulfobotulus alkaliphilus TaxID=622671 RepID=A0A562S602_9BACT|nr:hypothetical protein [Desulfobotulus alkaliphilus]TWI76745.1 hypothetical protein LZ24_00366 [Desulfobotulus alkaliphilus]